MNSSEKIYTTIINRENEKMDLIISSDIYNNLLDESIYSLKKIDKNNFESTEIVANIKGVSIYVDLFLTQNTIIEL